MTPRAQHGALRLFHGDALEVLRGLPDASVDALVTDPPAGISFMGKEWDHDHGGREGWVAAFAAIFRECRRVLKPGAHGLVWALPRTSHWTATALEDAGFVVRDVITHHFGSGFPKSVDVSKAIDAALGAERAKVRIDGALARNPKSIRGGHGIEGGDRPCLQQAREVGYHEMAGPDAVTPEAAQWQGWGTALKPATEHWILVRAPFAEKTIAANVLRHGTGALHIDAARVPLASGDSVVAGLSDPANRRGVVGNAWQAPSDKARQNAAQLASVERTNTLGRWPTNLVLSHSDACRAQGTERVKVRTRPASGPTHTGPSSSVARNPFAGVETSPSYVDADGTEAVEVWDCAPDCPIAELNRQSGESVTPAEVTRGGNSRGFSGLEGIHHGERVPCYGDEGGASRFFPTFPGDEDAPDAAAPYGMRKTALGRMNDDGWQPKEVPRTGFEDSGGASRYFPTFPQDAPEDAAAPRRLTSPDAVQPGYDGGFRNAPTPSYDDDGGAARFFPTFPASEPAPAPPPSATPSTKNAYGEYQHRSTVHHDDDATGAARFFPTFRYEPKASPAERDDGLADAGMAAAPVHRFGAGIGEGHDPSAPAQNRNIHPTVKPVGLMRWLVRLITPPGGIVLDPFVGSGTTLVAAHAEERGAIGIEREAVYATIAEARLPRQYSLFGPEA